MKLFDLVATFAFLHLNCNEFGRFRGAIEKEIFNVGAHMSKVIIDVRERDEYAIEHVEHSVNVPLSVFSNVAPGVLKQLEDRDILFMCHSGIRAAQARKLAAELGYHNEHTYDVYEGGLLQWMKDGKDVIKGNSKSKLSIQRQVQLIVGLLVIVFGVMGLYINPWYSIAGAAMGAGLFVAGATGYCLMAQMVGWMPWNKAAPQGESCAPCEQSVK